MAASAAPAQSINQHYAIEAQPLSAAIKAFAQASGASVVADSRLTAGKQAAAVTGDLTPREAADRLLVGTGLHIEEIEGTFVVRPDTIARAPDPQSTEITVTGSRIRGAPPASPVIVIGRQQMIDAGQATVADALRSLPQNFPGGQNPEVALGANAANSANGNATGGSAINLRGLGPDATLTLLNGHRVAYDGSSQGVDISTIPLAALDRVEIVADGASALYGSDAVGGVANIILRKEYDGISLSARGGLATAGGNRQQLYSAVGGKKWSSGGFIATYSHQQDTQILSDDRAYTRYMLSPNTLLPSNRSDSAIVSGHQDLGEQLTFAIDGTFNKRVSRQKLASTTVSDIANRAVSYSISPSLTARLGPWTLGLLGTHGHDDAKSFIDISRTSDGPVFNRQGGCLCNILKAGEATAEGPLLSLPGGTARLALGGGYRENDLVDRSYDLDTTTRSERRSGYGYGELFVPLIGPDMAVPMIRRLSATGAVRYEHYGDLGGVTTPKFGLLYSPVASVDLKASWGKSFKAPLLSQQHLQAYAFLYPTYAVGGQRFAADSTALLAYGSQGGLRPERANSWTTTIDLHPVALSHFHALASYFHVAYRDRIIQPASITAALSSPLYTDFITYSPTVSQLNAVINRSDSGLINFTSGNYDPAGVVAIINDYYTNVAAQTIQGVDLQADYSAPLATGELTVTAQASYLKSRQRNAPGAPSAALAGTLFNPPHVRARAGVIWKSDAITASTFLNYLGGIDDIRQAPATSGNSMATLDAAVRWTTAIGAHAKDSLEVALAVQNLANERPPFLRHDTNYYVPYDSTNYSAIGRTVALELTTHW